MRLALGEVAELVGGKLNGDATVAISGAAIIRDAAEGDITLADKPHLMGALAACKASAVLVPPNVEPAGLPLIVVEDVHMAFGMIVKHFRPQFATVAKGVSPEAKVSGSASIGPDVAIHAGATVGDETEIGARTVVHAGVRILAGCKIGEDAVLFPNAVLYEHTVVGDRVLIHANAVLGAYGFGYQTIEGKHKLTAQLGNVVIEDDVEIGACTTIDRGTYGPTTIGAGTKIDNQVMIGHNCRIGRHNLLCSQVGIAGSCRTGDYVVMAGQVGLRDHIEIGECAILGAKSGIMNDIPAHSSYFGIPATPDREQFRMLASTSKLPEMRKELKALQKQFADFVRQLSKAA